MSSAPRGTLRHAFSRVRQQPLPRAALITFACIVHLSIFADFFASAQPVLARADGELVVLANLTHDPRIDVARTRNTLQVLVPALVPFGADDEGVQLLPPLRSSSHPLGTDIYGRDVFARLMHGGRLLMSLALASAALVVVLGSLFGALAAFYGGILDVVVSRLVESLSAFPTVLLVLVLQAMSEHPSKTFLVFAVGISRFAEVVRLVRAEVLHVVSNDYVLAARALGASPLRVLARHVGPNARAQAIASATFSLSSMVLAIAACDFLGFGLSKIAPTWGETMAEIAMQPEAWWLLAFPALALFVTVVSQTLVGEALLDALDPRAIHEGR